MSVASRGRLVAERQLRDRCDIQSVTGWTTDAMTGERVPTWTTYAAGVPCRVRTTLGESVTEAGGSQVTAQRMVAAIPVAQTGVVVGHRLVVTLSDDPTLVGLALYVRAIPRGTDLVLRRLTVSDVQE